MCSANLSLCQAWKDQKQAQALLVPFNVHLLDVVFAAVPDIPRIQMNVSDAAVAVPVTADGRMNGNV